MPGRGLAAVLGGAVALATSSALAAAPTDWGINLQPAASPVAEEMLRFHNNLLLPIITGITLFVMALLLFVMIRFNRRRNPTSSRTTHNVAIEVVWTVVPVLILVLIAIPSFRLLYFADRLPADDVDLTIKAIGNQWFWTYEYPDQNFQFDAYMIDDDDLEPGQPRLLATDNAVVLPVETNIRILLTANDVLHAWAVPALGVKKDTVPGRLNETWFRINEEYEGETLYGQCSELCGVLHAYMPIEVRAVSREDFDAWVEEAQQQFSTIVDEPPPEETAGQEAGTSPRLAEAGTRDAAR